MGRFLEWLARLVFMVALVLLSIYTLYSILVELQIV